ncbi:SMI1/KNR4 family protein [Shewanella sp. C32]|uniref:SMI1/KNR4 family protein n=1 Tax=Shewanella electrica TaxID=515560 RepID=A0ABT2FFR4_9GAMM|nr:SMI1/KNR4 family protein [Shewanella electrica]MCH1925307.1 SMI1/KNR4 family protein [Shewanella electrica]MCS4555132.1 SMI1/KNR4 family protein [Shewanella electrica]
MKIDDIEHYLQQAANQGDDIWRSQPASAAAVEQLQAAIDYPLPSALTQFLLSYGALGVNDRFISGIIDNQPLALEGGNILADTAFLREEQPSLPPHFIVIQSHEDGAYCLDLSQPDPISVVNFEWGHSHPFADSFEQFLEHFFYAEDNFEDD